MADFALKIEPADRLVIASKKLGEEAVHLNIKLTNTSKERCSFKVKCTSNELFRIRPPLGILRTDDVATVALTFNGGKTIPDNGKHYVAFYYINVGEEKKPARQLWQDHKGDPTGTKRIYVDFKKEDLADANNNEKKEDGKKDDEKKDEKKEEDKKDEEKKEDKKEEAKKEDEKKEEDKKEEKKDDEKKDEEKKEEEKKDEEKKE